MEPAEPSETTAPKMIVPSSASDPPDVHLKPADSEANVPEPTGAPNPIASSGLSSAEPAKNQKVAGGSKASRAATCTHVQASSRHDRLGNR